MTESKEKVFEVTYSTPNGKMWSHMISTSKENAGQSFDNVLSIKETNLDPVKDYDNLNLPEWMY